MKRNSVIAGIRQIKDGKEYDILFQKPLYTDPIISADADVNFTVSKMAEIAIKKSDQTKKIAEKLKADSIEKTCKNIWSFVFNHFQYTQDKLGVEQLREPARSWADRKTGIDCDCMSIFVASILNNLGINYRFRIAAFTSDDYEHVYIVVPVNGKNMQSGQIIIDPVIHEFDVEKTYKKAQDFNSNGMAIQVLNGIPLQTLNGVKKLNEVEQNNERLRNYIEAQLNAIGTTKNPLPHIDNEQAIRNLKYALKNWAQPYYRYNAVETLANLEQKYNPETFMFRTILHFFDGTADCSTVCANGYINLAPEVIDAIQGLNGLNGEYDSNPKMHETSHKIAKVPAAPARGAFLLLLRFNVFGYATKIASAFFPAKMAGEEHESGWYYGRVQNGEAYSKFNVPKTQYNLSFSNAFGLTHTKHLNNRKKLYDNILRRWYNLGGDWDEFKKAALKGAEKKLLHRVKALPGYKYWCLYDDYNLRPANNTNPTSVETNFQLGEINGLNGINNQLGEVVAATILTAAAAVIAALAPFLVLMDKPQNAIDDTIVNGQAMLNPSTNPDPINHTNAVISQETGLWTDPKTGETYNPGTGKWENLTSSNSLKKLGLLLLATVGIGLGVYSLIPDNKSKTKKTENE